ncbi:MAG TPA: hypothetical protein VL053_01305 [Arachidicoccus sp.]|nr:hypothetical protein [Arachidicoccus sp.]
MEENEINQNLPETRNEFHKVRLCVLMTESWLGESMRSFFDAYDITAQQYHIMRIVQHAEKPLSILQIRERMLEKMCDASRLIDRLILKELVIKKVAQFDKRLVEVFLTERGEALLTSIKENIAELDKPIESNLSEQEAKTMCTLLLKMKGCNSKLDS